MKSNPLLEQSQQLAINIESLCNEISSNVISNTIFQIKKSSSSIFANISEGQYPQSLPDMLSKFRIALKECMETESWLDLLYKTNHITSATFKTYRNTCGRIRRMLISSCKTLEIKINS